MSHARVVPIVEGQGEVASVRVLLTRCWTELLGGDHIDVERPIRVARTRIVKPEDLRRSIELAARKLRQAVRGHERPFVLLMLDADDDPACALAPQLIESVRSARPDLDVACVLPVVEYETWFVAAAESLSRYVNVGDILDIPEDPEAARVGKAWIQRRMRHYSETIDQPAMTAAMDLRLCRRRSRSFDKLCRELESRL